LPYNTLFGPVPSRRFGRSLGVDLVPPKTCSFDCVFCQVGRTTAKTVERKAYVPVEDVVAEFEDWLERGGTADTVTLSGSGEPTLHSGFGDVLAAIRDRCAFRRALLTNGSLLSLPEVRGAACGAEVVKVSLSAWDQASLETINRPDTGVEFRTLVDGLRAFRQEFSGELWLEVFVLAGLNADEGAMQRIAALAKSFGPDRIHLNTVVRPPADTQARPAAADDLARFAGVFEPKAEPIGEFDGESAPCLAGEESAILSMLTRRPCTADDVARVCGMHPAEVSKYLGRLVNEGRVLVARQDDRLYYASAEKVP
jgi:wyosine [tRNA(Phe)-imidazoG37] synthetase (radical SAM superfamily)